MSETVDHTTLSRLVAAGAISATHVVGQPGGWAVMVRYGQHESHLSTQRSKQVRLFRHLETLVSYLRDIGLSQFNVDASSFEIDDASRAKRPDRAAALKRAHQAATYDQWFREQVQASVDDPRPSLSNDQAHAHMEHVFAQLEDKADH